MFIPFISASRTSSAISCGSDDDLADISLFRRKGGGGRGGGGGGRSSGKSSTKSSTKASRPVAHPIAFAGAGTGGSIHATSGGSGGYPVSTIKDGPYKDRQIGGGTRNDIYGSSAYGSGYPGSTTNRGVANRGFPFVFFPIIWPSPMLVGYPGYYGSSSDGKDEYGSIDDPNRPGGPLTEMSLSVANSTSPSHNYTLRIISDRDTIENLYPLVNGRCVMGRKSAKMGPKVQLNNSSVLHPNDALQYYRASSVVLTLDGYNNTAALDAEEPFEPARPLPTFVDSDIVLCVNRTIGESILLVNSAVSTSVPSYASLALLLVIFSWFSNVF